MKIKTTKQKEYEFEVPVPSFFKKRSSPSDFDVMGILNESTAVCIYKLGDLIIVKSYTPAKMELEISRAIVDENEYEKISEEEFLSIHAGVLNLLSLTPQLVEKGNDDLPEIFSQGSSQTEKEIIEELK